MQTRTVRSRAFRLRPSATGHHLCGAWRARRITLYKKAHRAYLKARTEPCLPSSHGQARPGPFRRGAQQPLSNRVGGLGIPDCRCASLQEQQSNCRVLCCLPTPCAAVPAPPACPPLSYPSGHKLHSCPTMLPHMGHCLLPDHAPQCLRLQRCEDHACCTRPGGRAGGGGHTSCDAGSRSGSRRCAVALAHAAKLPRTACS